MDASFLKEQRVEWSEDSNNQASAHSSSENTSVRMHHAFSMPESTQSSMDDTYLRELLGSSLPNGSPAMRSVVRRTQSCGVHTQHSRHTQGYRLMIGYRDEALRERCQRNTQQLLQTAMDEASAQSNSAILARKAVRYRKILERMEAADADVSDPAFDLSECLGVRWQRFSNTEGIESFREDADSPGYERLRLKYQPRIRYLQEHPDLRNAPDAGPDPEQIHNSSNNLPGIQQTNELEPEAAPAPLSYSDDEEADVEVRGLENEELSPQEISAPPGASDAPSASADEALPPEPAVDSDWEHVSSEHEEDGLKTLVGVYFDTQLKRVITDVCWPLAHRGGGLQDASKRAPVEPVPEWFELEQTKYFAFMFKTLSWLFPGLPAYEAQDQTERDWKKDCEFDAFGTHGLSLEGFTISILDLVTACTDGSSAEGLGFLGQLTKRLETSLPVFRVPTTSTLPPGNDEDHEAVRDAPEQILWQLVPLSTLIPCQIRPRPQFFELKARLAIAPIVVLILAGDERVPPQWYTTLCGANENKTIYIDTSQSATKVYYFYVFTLHGFYFEATYEDHDSRALAMNAQARSTLDDFS
ncbi:hypothetical protein ATCC90586_001643 [Pythium insidiosum]|nr:hypothetical protein ATCC90586_001643 [Pythium insidiosum]